MSLIIIRNIQQCNHTLSRLARAPRALRFGSHLGASHISYLVNARSFSRHRTPCTVIQLSLSSDFSDVRRASSRSTYISCVASSPALCSFDEGGGHSKYSNIPGRVNWAGRTSESGGKHWPATEGMCSSALTCGILLVSRPIVCRISRSRRID